MSQRLAGWSPALQGTTAPACTAAALVRARKAPVGPSGIFQEMLSLPKHVEHTSLPIQVRYFVPAAGRRGSSYKASWRGTEPVTGRNALMKGNVKHELIPEHSWAGFDCWAPALEREVPLKLDAERGALRAGSWSPTHNDSMFWKVLDEVYCFFIILWSCVCRCWKCSFASSTTLFCLQIFYKSELQSSFASTY